MWNRIFKQDNQQDKKTTAETPQSGLFQNLEKENQVLTQEQMNKVEGGHTAITQFIKEYDWNATLGGNMPQ